MTIELWILHIKNCLKNKILNVRYFGFLQGALDLSSKQEKDQLFRVKFS